ncbi:MFS transporter [Ferruginivarius sediminum]|uniref:MFS transporter n=1 Tax=Ferruginivarius sediminum TaxID=2661937 RepID=UPI00137A2DFB|nr:MFS transporter [Ferruginivarius sediminum]
MSRRSARLSLIFSALGHGYMHLFAAFYFVIVLALEADWGLPYHELVELWTLGALLIGLVAVPAGWLGDRWSTTGMMIVFFLGMGLAGIVCGLVDGPTAMMLGLAAIGVFAAIYHPVGIPWVVKNATAKGKALGINGIFGAVGIAGAGIVAGTLIDLASWRAAFIVPGIVSVVTGLALLACRLLGWIEEPRVEKASEEAHGRGDMLRAFTILLVTMFMMGLVFQATQAALPKVFDLRLRDLAGEGAFGIGAIVAAVYTVGGVMQVLGGHMADRLPLKAVYLGAFLLQVPILALLAALGGVPLIVVAMVTVLLSTGALPAENMMLARYTPDRHRSLAFGVKFVLAFGAAPVAMQIVGFIQGRTGEFVWLFLFLALCAGIAALAAAILPGGLRGSAPQESVQPAE